MSAPEVILFDIDCKKRICWSPNTAKPRYVLALKKIPYKTTWVSYPDIAPLLRSHGQEDNETVTCPVLKYDDTYVPDSLAIAEFLEKHHPTPSIFPAGREATLAFLKKVVIPVKANTFNYIVAQIPPILDDRGAEYFIDTREKRMGPLDAVSAPGDAGFLPKLKEVLEPVVSALQAGKYLMGDEFGWCDAELLGIMQWIKQADETKFDKVMELDESGMLKKYWERCAPYMKRMD